VGRPRGFLALRAGLAVPGEAALSAGAAGAAGAASGRVLLADLDGDLRLDAVRVGPRSIEVFAAPPPARDEARRALRVSLRGTRDDRRGVGAIVEVRAGAVYRRIFWRGEPVVVGLGGAERADVVRVSWPNGVVQSETRVPASASWCSAGARVVVPFLFVWDERRFSFAGTSRPLAARARPGPAPAPARRRRDGGPRGRVAVRAARRLVVTERRGRRGSTRWLRAVDRTEDDAPARQRAGPHHARAGAGPPARRPRRRARRKAAET
jgi:hypothetical protein